MHPRNYLIILFGVAGILVTGVVAIDMRIDPFGLAAAPNTGDYRYGTEGARPGAFWSKAFAVRYVRPRTVVLGTSRAQSGIDPHSAVFAPDDAPVLNLSLGGLSIDQIRLLLIHANRTFPVRRAIIGLDLESFLDSGRGDFDAAALEGNPESEPEGLVRLRINLSREALSASAARLFGPVTNEPPQAANDDAADLAPGRISDATLKLFEGQRGIIWTAEYGSFSARLPLLFRQMPPGTLWSTDRRRAAAMSSFRKLLDYARQEGIDLRMFISPVHARYLVWYQQIGWWPLFEAWKHALVDVVAQESTSSPDRSAYVLWDFSGFHSLATEPVPSLGDLATRMHWYRETSHYSPELGNLILDRVLGGPGSGASQLPKTRIDTATIDGHLAQIRLDAATYRQSHPQEVANINEMLTFLRRAAGK